MSNIDKTNDVPTPDETHLILIRHGQAKINVTPIMGGMRGDTGLTDLGVHQAERLRNRLQATGELKADVFITSSLPRARQTAEIITPAIGFAPTIDDDVQEFRVGPEADGLHLEEYTRRYGWVSLEEDPFRATDPGGDSLATFALRVSSALDRITRQNVGKTIAVVCHGGVIDISFIFFMGLSGFQLPQVGLATANTSLTHWHHRMNHGKMRWVLRRYNDDAHLHGLITSDTIDYSQVPAAEPQAPLETGAAKPVA